MYRYKIVSLIVLFWTFGFLDETFAINSVANQSNLNQETVVQSRTILEKDNALNLFIEENEKQINYNNKIEVILELENEIKKEISKNVNEITYEEKIDLIIKGLFTIWMKDYKNIYVSENQIFKKVALSSIQENNIDINSKIQSELMVEPIEEPDMENNDEEPEYGEKYPNIFAPWYCTYYVANNKSVSWKWHAKDWYSNAQKTWESVWKEPQIWSIVVFSWKWYNRKYWHVAIVKSINNDNNTFTVSEMNAKKRWIISDRKVKNNDYRIIWFIYAKDIK